MTPREKTQNGYFRGGEIGDVEFHPLTVDRMDILKMVHAEEITPDRPLDLSRVMMAIYSLDPDESQKRWTYSDLLERGRQFGGMTARDFSEFESIFEADMQALNASEIEPEGAAGSDDEPGKS